MKTFWLPMTLMAGLMLAPGCSDDSTPPPDGGTTEDGKVIQDVHISGPTLSGTITDALGEPVGGALVEAGGQLAYSSQAGAYELTGLTAGDVTVTVAQDWFETTSESVTLGDSLTTKDFTITEKPLKVEATDRTLAETYNTTFDWTTDTVSISIVESPSRKNLDNAIYFKNPALYRDTSGQATVTPANLPALSGGNAENFDFAIGSGDNQGAPALENIVDTLADTDLTQAEQDDFMMWSPLRNWLVNWDATKSTDLNAAGVAITQQSWGSDAVKPQAITMAYLHGQDLWVKVVFENFVELGSGITDSDADGRKEIFAKVNSTLYKSEIITKVQDDYITPTYNTHGLSKQLSDALNELYSTTAPEVTKYIGQAFEVTGAGSVAYPFVVLTHSGGQVNVLLVAAAQ
ncbi:MAG: carboxypeptidase regulatory-like domain-containing protein [Deltaproteobacteria bacterium]|nr:carboxypeptidase regulatory-like domain-containing protein [Deltaproteobacteria bacterium]